MKTCNCGSNSDSWEMFDGHGIYLCRVCEDCEQDKLARFRPDILEQYDTDEPIDD